MSKWEKNPEIVPEECYCDYDVDFGAGAMSARSGEDQASLGLDPFSVGYDLPLPSGLGAIRNIGVESAGREELGGPVIADEETIKGFSEDAGGGGDRWRKIPDRNETSSTTTTVPWEREGEVL